MQSDRRTPNREAPTFWQWVNPLWWACDAKRNPAWPVIPAIAWILAIPGVRWLCWFTRNPFCNFNSVIIGVAHKHRTCVYAKGDGWTYAERGLNYGYTRATWRPPLPFVSYRGEKWERCIGWKTSGAFGYAFRRANAHGWEP